MNVRFKFIPIKEAMPNTDDKVLWLWKDKAGEFGKWQFSTEEQPEGSIVMWATLPVDEILKEKWPYSGPLRLAQRGDQ